MALTTVTDGGLETDLLFHHGVQLPDFAAFPLVHDAPDLLVDYYGQYARIAEQAGAGLLLETPTWRANPDWGTRLGYDAAALDEVDRRAVELVRRAAPAGLHTQVSGTVGPRGDGYVSSRTDADEAADYHAPQVSSFAAAGADGVHALTLTTTAEAVGIVRAARVAGVPVGISFTLETDGRLPDGTPLAAAVAEVDAVAPPDWYGVNCAHPTHVAGALDGGAWQARLTTLRPNASTLTHEQLDAMEELDEGDRPLLLRSTLQLLAALPSVTTLGGCCGTDATHVAALWGVRPPS